MWLRTIGAGFGYGPVIITCAAAEEKTERILLSPTKMVTRLSDG